ncbi:MAG: hypothetical protein AB1782_17660 [Cyanobacteriota bacterium]
MFSFDKKILFSALLMLILVTIITSIILIFINSRYTVIFLDKNYSFNQDRIIKNYYKHLISYYQNYDLELPGDKFINLKLRKSITGGSNGNELKALSKCEIDNNVSELDNKYVYKINKINKNRTALILIDIWECHYNGGWLKRANRLKKDKILPLIELARKNNLPIIFVSYDTKMASDLNPQKGDLVSTDLNEIVEFLDSKKIKNLLYAGFATNRCLMFRPAGMVNMKYNYYYDVILIRDATIAFELPKTLKEELAKEVSINIIEQRLGPSTTLMDLNKSFVNSVK